MARKLCILHANCQGDAVAELLGKHPDFARRYEIRHYLNYTRQPIPEEDLASCAVFIYQHLGPDWGEFSSAKLLAGIPASCRTLCMPNLHFRVYWPLTVHDDEMTYGDGYLNKLVAMGLDKREIAHLYLHAGLSKYCDLDEEYERWLETERAKERAWDVKVVDTILGLMHRNLLFNTFNHPGRKLSLLITQEISRALGFGNLPPVAVADFKDPYPEFVQPIHPEVAAHHGLKFIPEDATFHIYGKQRTFTEYVNYYIECKSAGLGDFISYLRLRVHEKMSPEQIERVREHGAVAPRKAS